MDDSDKDLELDENATTATIVINELISQLSNLETQISTLEQGIFTDEEQFVKKIENAKQDLFEYEQKLLAIQQEIKNSSEVELLERALLQFYECTALVFQKELQETSQQRDSLKRIIECLDLEVSSNCEPDEEILLDILDYDISGIENDLQLAKAKQKESTQCLKISQEILDATLAEFEAEIQEGNLIMQIYDQVNESKELIQQGDENYVKRIKIEKCKVITCKVGLILIVVAIIAIIAAVIGVKIAN